MGRAEQYHDEDVSFAGQVVAGKYEVETLIGTGGMGTVWLGRHLEIGKSVAIKFIRPDVAERQDARKRFEIEARAAASVRSDHAVKIYDYGQLPNGLPFIVMEYLEGESLADMLVRVGPLPPREVARVIRQAAVALGRAHAAGIVHRDLKPDNIFLATNVPGLDAENPWAVKLVDFGIAKILDPSYEGGRFGGPTQDGNVIGTPNFMSPEQLTVGGEPNPLTDLWSLGACAFTAMTARIPFEGDVLGDIVLKVCMQPYPKVSEINPSAPPGFDAWFQRACAREPKQRFQSADELATALEGVCGVSGVVTQTHAEDRVQYKLNAVDPELLAELAAMEPRGISPKTALLAGLVIGVTLMIGTLGLIAWQRGPASQTYIDPTPSNWPAAKADAGPLAPAPR
jgi:serine/threonine-protein kinase